MSFPFQHLVSTHRIEDEGPLDRVLPTWAVDCTCGHRSTCDLDDPLCTAGSADLDITHVARDRHYAHAEGARIADELFGGPAARVATTPRQTDDDTIDDIDDGTEDSDIDHL